MIEAVSTYDSEDSLELEKHIGEINWMGWKIKLLSSTDISVSITWEFLHSFIQCEIKK